MSTFSGLATAYTGLAAAKTGLDVIGQNISNAGTDGYTRQRVELAGVEAARGAGRIGTGPAVGRGVAVTGISRLADARLDERVRAATGVAGFAAARADGLGALESVLNEPGANGLSAQLHDFWAAWQDLANTPDSSAAQAVVLQQASVVAGTVSSGYRAVAGLWTDARADLTADVDTLNAAAAQLADLNGRIRSASGSGATAAELLDQRTLLAQAIAGLAGGTVRDQPDGTMTVYVGGNALVSGQTAYRLQVVGGTSMTDAADPVRVQWVDHPTASAAPDGGTIAGLVSLLAPADATGTGGAYAEAARSFDAFATTLAAQVNAVHSAGTTTAGAPAGDFFAIDPAGSAALSLRVVPTDGSQLATALPGRGDLDGGTADAIARLGSAAGSPDAAWSAIVTGIATSTQSALRQSTVADLAATNAASAQRSQAAVDLDEENVNMITFQHAYQGAARVLTAIDEMLDTLINRTGTVGR